MKRLVVAWLWCVLVWQSSPAPADDEAKLAFDTYSGYFVSNQFAPGAAESFAVIADQDQFDKVFGVAMVMGDRSHRLSKDAFASSIVLAVVKNGKMVWKFHVEKITVESGVVRFQYGCKAKKTTTASFACPLIVSIPKGKYTAVEFVENKKPVKKIDINGR